MLEIKKSVVSLDERDLMELERIVTDSDEKEALRFMKKSISMTLSDEELITIQRILLDADKKDAIQFLKGYLGKKVEAVISCEGH